MGDEFARHPLPHPSQRQPAAARAAPPLGQAPGQAPPKRPPPPRPPPRPAHAPQLQYAPQQQYMGVPAGMGMPTGAQHWGAAGAGAYMVPTSMGMVAAGTPMQAMYPGVGGYMMVPGAYMMAGVGTVAPSAWPTQWQQFQQ